jgi:phosphatidylglycerophosphate synthase
MAPHSQRILTVRRPIKARDARWAQGLARYLAARGLKPNWISLASIAFAACGGAALLASPYVSSPAKIVLYLLAAACIQLRLLCNLLDGMVAVEGGLKTKSGEVFNDLPDRIADPLILVPAGYAISSYALGPELGWMAGLLAVLTAYVRVLGGSAGLPQRFTGPMAKQHRMAVMTVGLVLAAPSTPFGLQEHVLAAALIIIALGSVLTLARRTLSIVQELERR